MCGFVGFVGGPFRSEAEGSALVRDMMSRIAHRGPDSSGDWVDAEHRVALGHNRLAILDLSPAGHQPMASPGGRYVVIFNGEIYNHLELREELVQGGQGIAWRGSSDTETMLAGIEAWGLEATLKRMVGMFSLALWDRQTRQLTLARDRLGEKPLYFGWQGTGTDAAFLFGSELKALRRHPSFVGEIDRSALTSFLRYNYVPAPHSIYTGISKLAPGTYLTLDLATREISKHCYWSALEVAERGVAHPFAGSADDAVNALEEVLSQAVSQQMLSDVPLGAFLSGGIDSSTIVALMQQHSSRPVKSFSIGFHEEAYDEARYAKQVAAHIGTDHTEMYVSPDQAMDVIPSLPVMYDEPFADSSQIPTYLVSKLAREHVTVSLSGDAGDELFAGYNRYNMTSHFWGRLSRVPRPIRAGAARGLQALSPRTWNKIGSAVQPIIPRSARMALLGEKVHKGAGVLASGSVDELYLGLTSQWRQPQTLVVDAPAELERSDGAGRFAELGDVQGMMARDMLTYLPDDILAKVDRAAMRVSLETRVPFLDHRVVEFAWRLPLDYKIRDGQTKWVLRRLLDRHVPRTMIERPKMGFGVPIDSWLRGPLKDWAADLLDPRKLQQQGYLQSADIQAAWTSHQRHDTNLQHQLWGVLMFQSWLEAQSA